MCTRFVYRGDEVITETAMPEHCCMSMEIPQGPMRTGKAV